MAFLKEAEKLEKLIKSLKGKEIDIEKKNDYIVQIMEMQADLAGEFFQNLIDIVSDLVEIQEKPPEIEVEEEPEIEEVKDIVEVTEDMTVAELKKVAKGLGMKGYSKLKEAELISEIKKFQE